MAKAKKKTNLKLVKSATPKKAPVKKAGPAKPAKKAAPKPATNAKVIPLKPTAKMTAAKAFNLKPLDNRIVIEVEEGVKMTPGGLYIPDTAQATGNCKGKVIAVGSGHVSKKGKKRPLELKIGDEVLFAEYAGDKLEYNGKAVRILRESDVLGLVD